jgi:hypothetical protein
MKKMKFSIASIALLILSCSGKSFGQSMQGPSFYEGLFSPSPDVGSSATYNIMPVTLYTGMPQVSFPIYAVRAGSLTVPISLDYNYNGLRPKEDASWTGLGWNLTVGGVITRIVQGQVDGTRATGFNYDQYNLHDSVVANRSSWLQNAVAGNYDLAPDIYIFNFPGHGGKFVYYQGSGYTLPYQKLSIFKASNDSYFQITDENGISYLFNVNETTTPPAKPKYPTDPTIPPFKSSWHLAQMISANKKDTINFNYSTPYTYTEYGSPYGQEDWQHLVGGLPSDSITNNFWMAPNISTEVLSSIDCNHTHIDFITSTARQDMYNAYPELDQINITDKITGNIVSEYGFTYSYFSNTSNNNWSANRLKLTGFKQLAPVTGADDNFTSSLNYNFYYLNESANFPKKDTYGIDNWGFYNGKDANPNIFPASIIGSNGGNRDPNFSYVSYGVLDSIVYPTGGSTSFQYELNTYSGNTPGPGVRVKTVTAYANNGSSPSIVKNYGYSGGSLFNAGSELTSYNYTNTSNNTTYTVYDAGLCSAFGGIIDNAFYYTSLTETVSSGYEVHQTVYNFNAFVDYLTGMDMTQKTDYSYSLASGSQPLNQLNNSFAYQTSAPGKTFYTTNVVQTSSPTINYSDPLGQIVSAWKYPMRQTVTYYDKLGNTNTDTTNFYYNTTTTNLKETSTNNSDGSYTLNKLKFLEDYTTSITGGLINKHVLSPVIEQQVWRKNSSTDSVILSGKIIAIDTNLVKTTDEYYLEISSPMHTLSNETQTGGLYNTLVCDANYVDRIQYQYDGNANLLQKNPTNNISETYLWAYGHNYLIAKATNATSSQVAYTSFETTDKGNWSYSGASTTGGKTGDYQYSLSGGNITSPTLAAGTYVVSYWSNSSAATVSSTGSVSTKVNGEADGSGWSYYEYLVTLSASGTVTISGTVSIDELRLYPSNAQMSTMTYHPAIGITSECSPSNKISYYKYDGFSRLYQVTDQQNNILRTVQYKLLNTTQGVQ